MAMMDPNTWNGQDDTLPSAAEDDFQQFLDMGGMSNLGDGLQFDFPDFNAANGGPTLHPSAGHRDDLDTPMSGTNAPTIVSGNHLGIQNQMTPISSGTVVPALHTHADAILEIDAQIQFLQHQRLQQQHRQLEEQQRRFEEQQAAFFAQQQRNMVPPTPQSLKLQAASHYYTPGDQTPQHSHSTGMFDRFHRLKEQQDMSFTPLVSPAVTPLDKQFSVETQYTIPGAYFSPLSSPALHAQNEPMSSFERQLGSNANSPGEMDLETSAIPATSVDLSKKVRKNNVTKARKSSVRQSPIAKPQRKTKGSTPIMNAQALSELAETAAGSRKSERPAQSTTASAASTDDSENTSVSPEALSEMPPPPIPQPPSARQSPYISPQNHSSGVVSHTLLESLNGMPSPATPASLFRISPKGKSADGSYPGQIASEQIENFELPESASFPRLALPQLNTRVEEQLPLEVETSQASALPSLLSPSFPKPMRPTSSSKSPQIGPKPATPILRKTPVIAPRGSKKRGSVSSVQISPALLPRISPNIKPLLPGTPGMQDISAGDSASRLLASKSNYQNILEGNKVPGVSYPSELSTNLTSKRTSHKIAEQGRRNRINMALQEIATLLPISVTKDMKEDEAESPGGDKKDGKSSSGPNSKASTVEMAIVYIKQLQQEVMEANKRAEEAEKKLSAAAT
ncbi:uncharacterized protein BCR38DRAFT_483489 [Pseudomassariella vexata]|uniref:BHLH domain-containing protein n=1 Tax=Pseudomassariella vexata TaxID=1141098 RepID=A0A1Y2E2S7_9PEZI|nr:uncharacterized protein BCR38DRAFT_483489 [Pseudomassariella vexata]ORY65809.1 hypothetical protein BCR38DRAFT_483489 [Pseudomassariella vexata]